MDRKSKGQSEHNITQYKSASKMTDNASMISNISKASSNKSKSKERSQSKVKNSSKLLTLVSKDQLIKKVAKPSLHLNKSGLIKCKSANHAQYFKK